MMDIVARFVHIKRNVSHDTFSERIHFLMQEVLDIHHVQKKVKSA